jgi:hypothetical protein
MAPFAGGRDMRRLIGVAGIGVVLVSASATAQLGSRPAEEWIKTLDRPVRGCDEDRRLGAWMKDAGFVQIEDVKLFLCPEMPRVWCATIVASYALHFVLVHMGR